MVAGVGSLIDAQRISAKLDLLKNTTIQQIQIMADNLIVHTKLSEEERLNMAARCIGYNTYEIAVRELENKESK